MHSLYLSIRSVIVLAVINLVIMLPMRLLVLINDYKLVVNRCALQIMAYIGMFTYVMNCTVNAVMVCVLSQKHRRVMFDLLSFRRCRRRGKFHPQTSDRSTDSTLRQHQSTYRMQRFRTATNRSVMTDEYPSLSTTTSSRY